MSGGSTATGLACCYRVVRVAGSATLYGNLPLRERRLTTDRGMTDRCLTPSPPR